METPLPAMPPTPKDASKEKRACINQASQVHKIAIVPAKSCSQCVRRGDICWATERNISGIGRRCGMCILRHYQCDLKRGKEGKLRPLLQSPSKSSSSQQLSSDSPNQTVKEEPDSEIVLPKPLKTPRSTQAAKRASGSHKPSRKLIEIDAEEGPQSEPQPKRSRRSTRPSGRISGLDMSSTPDTNEALPSPVRKPRPSRMNDAVLSMCAPRIPDGPEPGDDLWEKSMLQMRLIQVQSELTSQKAKKKQLQEKFDQLEEQTTAKALGSGDPKYVKATVMSMQVKLAEKDKLIEKLNAMIKKLETANEIMSRDEFRSSPVEYIYELTRERDELVKRVEQLEGDKVGDAEDTCTE